jgi:transposase
MLFPPRALERAMKVREVILRALSGEYSWMQAAEILGITPRGLRRLRTRLEERGYEGLVDRRRGRPSPRRTPAAEVQRVVALYRDRYQGFNGRHFHDTVRRDHGVTLSYTHVKQLLHEAGLLRRKQARGRHRQKRERRACFGEMLHLDGSRHEWLALLPDQKQTMIQVTDDATSRLLYAQLWSGETCQAVMTALRDVIGEHGIPISLYTDRAGWAFETPKAGGKVDKAHLTQVGAALARLGVEHIPSYSPQARGRSERLNGTLQGRVVNELRAAGIATVEHANEYLRTCYLAHHNQRFSVAARDGETAFVTLQAAELDEIFFEQEVRVVGKDNTVRCDGRTFQIRPQPGRRTCAGLAIQIRRQLDGSYSIWRGAQRFGCYDADGTPAVNIPKSVRPMEAAGPVETRTRPRLSTRTLDAGKRRRRPQLPQGPAAEG